MIITCPNCKKQFKIDNSLIPDEGRDVQCGSCDHIWFYKIENDNNEILELREEIINNDKKNEVVEKKEEKNKKISEKQKTINTSVNNKNKGSKFFSYLIVFVISLIALIILLDTIKTPLINIFPDLEIVLFNLFETLQDIKLFIIDLS
tara:strand:+ start:96 stop:539 length:444 start_codon:yes stop_codon:yes gene_type:complete